jgi:hypothetical protein
MSTSPNPLMRTDGTALPDASTTPVIGPDGSQWDIPAHRVQDAIAQGGKLAANILGPDNSRWLVPLDRVHDAIKQGGQLIGSAPQAPQPDVLDPSVPTMEQNTQDIADKAGESFGLAAGGGELADVKAGEEAMPFAKKMAQQIFKHLSKYLGIEEEAAATGKAAMQAGAAEEPAAAAATETPKPARKFSIRQSRPLIIKESAPEVPAAAQTSTAASPATESAEDFVNRQTGGRATVTPNEEGAAVDSEIGEAIEPKSQQARRAFKDGKWHDVPPERHFTAAEKQSAVDDYFARHPDERPQPTVAQRGPGKGQVKMRRVFADGKWHDVPVYK